MKVSANTAKEAVKARAADALAAAAAAKKPAIAPKTRSRAAPTRLPKPGDGKDRNLTMFSAEQQTLLEDTEFDAAKQAQMVVDMKAYSADPANWTDEDSTAMDHYEDFFELFDGEHGALKSLKSPYPGVSGDIMYHAESNQYFVKTSVTVCSPKWNVLAFNYDTDSRYFAKKALNNFVTRRTIKSQTVCPHRQELYNVRRIPNASNREFKNYCQVSPN